MSPRGQGEHSGGQVRAFLPRGGQVGSKAEYLGQPLLAPLTVERLPTGPVNEQGQAKPIWLAHTTKGYPMFIDDVDSPLSKAMASFFARSRVFEDEMQKRQDRLLSSLREHAPASPLIDKLSRCPTEDECEHCSDACYLGQRRYIRHVVNDAVGSMKVREKFSKNGFDGGLIYAGNALHHGDDVALTGGLDLLNLGTALDRVGAALEHAATLVPDLKAAYFADADYRVKTTGAFWRINLNVVLGLEPTVDSSSLFEAILAHSGNIIDHRDVELEGWPSMQALPEGRMVSDIETGEEGFYVLPATLRGEYDQWLDVHPIRSRLRTFGVVAAEEDEVSDDDDDFGFDLEFDNDADDEE
jgi:hypothetical protein